MRIGSLTRRMRKKRKFTYLVRGPWPNKNKPLQNCLYMLWDKLFVEYHAHMSERFLINIKYGNPKYVFPFFYPRFLMVFCSSLCLYVSQTILVAWCKTAVSPLLTHLGYCRLTPSHRYIAVITAIYTYSISK